LDFGRLHFGPDMALHLYGTPGQSRFDFMWDLLIHKAHAYIVLVPANRPSEFRNARRIISFMNQRVDIPFIIGLTHVDCIGAWFPENIALALGYPDPKEQPKMIPLNATESDSVAEAVALLVQELMNYCN